VPVNGDDHFPIGHLSWKPVTPGFMLIQQIAPAALFGFGVVVSAVIILGLGLRNTSQKLLASKAELVNHRGELEETVRVRTAEIERQAAELDRMLKQERQVNARQRQFVAMASHEFRTPLAVIDAAAQRLIRQKETPTSAYISEKVEQIRHSVARMVDLMESILSVGRLAEGVNGIQRTEVDIKELVAACCQRQGDIRKSHRFHLEFEDFPRVVNADGPALEQVLTNLVANAIKYAPNSPDIMIRGRKQDGAVHISIQDFGIGMDAEDIPLLFQPYFRARSATGIAGTGIGLNLAKQIIELHGGTITVESELGRGTTFTITLPMNLHTDSSLPEKSREAA
jgi:signal transduction histidine kinase